MREAWESLKSTYVALGLKHLQAYLNEYTGYLPGAEETMRQKLLRMCGDSGDPLPPTDRAPTEPAPCGCNLIEMLERVANGFRQRQDHDLFIFPGVLPRPSRQDCFTSSKSAPYS